MGGGLMKKNMGGFDRILRLVLAAVVAVLFLFKQITGTAAIVLGIFGVVFLLTALSGFCPLCAPLGFSTHKKDQGSGPTRIDG
jgi:hypothetical protein